MHFNFKGYLILIIIIIIFVAYKFVTPYIRHLLLHFDSKDLYGEFAQSKLPWQIYAKSEQDKNIYLLELGKEDNTTIIFGAFHGDEQTGFHLVVQLAETLYTKPEFFHSRVVLVPVVNPDGLLNRSRTNANGVDINRNFPTENWTPVYKKRKNYPGTEPASEAETRVVMELIDKYKPDKIISIHDNLRMNNYNGPAEDLAREMARCNNYPVSSSIGYPTPGSFGNYAGKELNIAVVTLELPDISPDEAWEQNREALIKAINF